MAAQELRYDWFEKREKNAKADVIAVAHHQDDSVETILLNLIRNNRNYRFIRESAPRNGAIVRPLLCVNREDIIHYLEASDKIM